KAELKSTASLKIIIAKQIFDTSMIPNSNFEWGRNELRANLPQLHFKHKGVLFDWRHYRIFI
ncbi:hypothetical protein, partial [Vibrio sp. OPT46]|uniref:hypothetical protein n=1 Tax=Vibrio sp. OPT46 TaxID=2778645 RepID=UPI001D15D6DC